MFDTEAFVDITSPITKGEETSISRPALSRCLHNVSLATPPWRFPQGHHRRAASRFSKISPRQTNSLLQCNSGQMMETARRQIVSAMKFVVFFGNLSVGNTRARGAPHSLLWLSYRVGRARRIEFRRRGQGAELNAGDREPQRSGVAVVVPAVRVAIAVVAGVVVSVVVIGRPIAVVVWLIAAVGPIASWPWAKAELTVAPSAATAATRIFENVVIGNLLKVGSVGLLSTSWPKLRRLRAARDWRCSLRHRRREGSCSRPRTARRWRVGPGYLVRRQQLRPLLVIASSTPACGRFSWMKQPGPVSCPRMRASRTPRRYQDLLFLRFRNAIPTSPMKSVHPAPPRRVPRDTRFRGYDISGFARSL